MQFRCDLRRAFLLLEEVWMDQLLIDDVASVCDGGVDAVANFSVVAEALPKTSHTIIPRLSFFSTLVAALFLSSLPLLTMSSTEGRSVTHHIFSVHRRRCQLAMRTQHISHL